MTRSRTESEILKIFKKRVGEEEGDGAYMVVSFSFSPVSLREGGHGAPPSMPIPL